MRAVILCQCANWLYVTERGNFTLAAVNVLINQLVVITGSYYTHANNHWHWKKEVREKGTRNGRGYLNNGILIFRFNPKESKHRSVILYFYIVRVIRKYTENQDRFLNNSERDIARRVRYGFCIFVANSCYGLYIITITHWLININRWK